MDPKLSKDVEPMKPCMDPRLIEPRSKPNMSDDDELTTEHTTPVVTNDVEQNNDPGESSDKDPSCYAQLYEAARGGDWEVAKEIFKSDPGATYADLSASKETALHIAAEVGQTKFVLELLDLIPAEKLGELKTNSGRTVLHYSVFAEDIEASRAMVTKYPNLTQIRDNNGGVPIYDAALSGFKDLMWYLCLETKDEDPSPFQGSDGANILNAAIVVGFYDVALYLVQRFPQLAAQEDMYNLSALETLSQKSSEFMSGSRLGFLQCRIYSWLPVYVERTSTPPHRIIGDPEDPPRSSSGPSHKSTLQHFLRGIHAHILQVPSVKSIHDTKLMHTQIDELVKCICAQVKLHGGMHSKISWLLGGAILQAAKFGTVEIIYNCLKSYPHVLTRRYSDTHHSILHLAIIHRQVKVFNHIRRLGTLRKKLAVWTDSSTGNTILHLAAILAPHHALNSVSGTALQMQRELQWYKEVEKIVPPRYKEYRNDAGKTPRVLFTEEHSNLVEKGEKWMKSTASSCMLVATLIATVVFAAAFTVPGGNKNDGRPFFLNAGYFMVFIIADVFALFSSTTSVLIFLSVLTSRYAEEDFLTSLPRKLIFGLSTLFFSIASMMVAFTVTFFIMLGHQYSWASILIALLASVPVSLFVRSHFPLLVEMVLSTYGSNIIH